MDLGSSFVVGMLLSAIIPLAAAAIAGVVLFKFLNGTLRPALSLLQTQNTGAPERKMKAPVEGELLLTGSSIPAPHAAYQTCNLTGVISAPGMPMVPAIYRGLVSTAKFPPAGQTLPVSSVAMTLVTIIILAASIPLVVKRLKDRNKSPHYAWLLYGPAIISTIGEKAGFTGTPTEPNALGYALALLSFVIGIWFFIELGFLRGTAGPNGYGPDPLAVQG